MLSGLRQAANSWVAKVLLAVLVVSFGIWGIAGNFQGYGTGEIARVGDTEVSAVEFDRALRQRLQAIQNQTGGQFTMEQARAIGVPQQVLGEMISNAALDDQARDMNLGVSDDKLASIIAADQTFQGADGKFDRARFQALLRNAGVREDDYVQDIRANIVRRQLAQALIGGVGAPQPMVKALYELQNEERRISFVTVDQSAVEPVGDPDPAALQAYFEDHQAEFRAPEYRKLGLVVVDPATVADPSAVSDQDVEAEYQRRIADFTRPERRRVEQIRYDTKDDAEAAAQALQSGKSFDDLAAERGLSAADIDLGMKTKEQIVDPVIADAAFSAESGAVVPVPDAQFGAAIIRVAEVEAGNVTPLAEAAPQIRKDLAATKARDAVYDLHDRIEDERAGGATLQEVAATLSLPYRTIEAIAADGTAPDGSRPDVPSQQEVVSEAFASDVGVENDPVRTGSDGYVFYEVLETTPARDRTLDEARDKVVAAWRSETLAEKVSERAQALMERLEKGATMDQIAAELGKSVEIREGVKRGSQPEGLTANAVAQAFAGPEGHVADADGATPEARILLHVDSVTVPAFFAEAASGIDQAVGRAMQNDVLQAYNSDLLLSRPPRVNNAMFAQITGSAGPN